LSGRFRGVGLDLEALISRPKHTVPHHFRSYSVASSGEAPSAVYYVLLNPQRVLIGEFVRERRKEEESG
jgi:hypothetical protein